MNSAISSIVHSFQCKVIYLVAADLRVSFQATSHPMIISQLDRMISTQIAEDL